MRETETNIQTKKLERVSEESREGRKKGTLQTGIKQGNKIKVD